MTAENSLIDHLTRRLRSGSCEVQHPKALVQLPPAEPAGRCSVHGASSTRSSPSLRAQARGDSMERFGADTHSAVVELLEEKLEPSREPRPPPTRQPHQAPTEP